MWFAGLVMLLAIANIATFCCKYWACQLNIALRQNHEIQRTGTNGTNQTHTLQADQSHLAQTSLMTTTSFAKQSVYIVHTVQAPLPVIYYHIIRSVGYRIYLAQSVNIESRQLTQISKLFKIQIQKFEFGNKSRFERPFTIEAINELSRN